MSKIAALQMTSTADVKNNLSIASQLILQAKQQQAQLVLLPENFACMVKEDKDRLALAEKFQQGHIQAWCQEQAATHQITLVAGTIPLISEDQAKATASSLVFNPQGQCIARYDKKHLFDVEVAEQEAYQESEFITPGQQLVTVATDVGKIGLSVCYDVRFPELYRELVDQGAEILLIPAAFTRVTGLAHWHVLCRARAIENLCYVLAANQGGVHDNGRETYGHSLIIDPWGKILAEASETPSVIVASIELNQLHQQRKRFPCLEHKTWPC